MRAHSGYTRNNLQSKHQTYSANPQPLVHGTKAMLPNNSQMGLSVQGILTLNQKLNTHTLIFPHRVNESRLSIGQLCDNGCIALFDIKSVLHFKEW